MANLPTHFCKRSLAAYLFVVFLFAASTTSRAKAQLSDMEKEAQRVLNQGVEAFKNGQYKDAELDLIRANELDPSLADAHLFLGKVYSSEYVPDATSENSQAMGSAACEEFKKALALEPQNVSAMDGLGSMLYQLAAQPFKLELFAESKSFFQEHIRVAPGDAEPYYWVGVIDWTLAFRANNELRDRFNQQTRGQELDAADPLPSDLRKQYERDYGPTIQEGIYALEHAISIKPDYDDAMAYLNLMYRRKADVVAGEGEREELIQRADDLIDRIKDIKFRRSQAKPD